MTSISGELGGKILELLKEIVPRLTRVAIVVSGQANILGQVRKQLEKIIDVVEVSDISTTPLREMKLDQIT